MSQPDVVIVGGGVIGAACARALALRGNGVLLLDDTQPGAATEAAAGMLAPLAEAQPEDPLLGFSVRARDLYAEVAPALREETSIDIGLWSEGILQIAFSEAEVSDLRDQVAWQRQRGFSAEWLPPEDLRDRVPGIGPDARGAAFAPEDGALEPLALKRALVKSAEAHGARVERAVAVDRLTVVDGRATGVRAGERTIAAGAVVVAAGCWSGRLDGLPRPLSVEPIRGQMLALDWPKGEPRAIVYGGGGYVLERGGEAIAGSTMEHAGYDASVTDEGMAAILSAAGRTYPALTRSARRRQWAGLRPGTPDGRPLLGRDPEVAGLWYATGHGRNGVLLAGLSGEVIGRLFAGEEVEHDLSPMNPARFWTS